MRSIHLLTMTVFIIAGALVSLQAQTADSVALVQIRGNMVQKMEGTFSATFQATPIVEVFKMLANETGLNIMISPKINQTVTARFKDVPIRDAFLSILSANDLYFIEQGAIIKIMTSAEYKAELLRNYLVTKTYDASVMDVKNVANIVKPVLTPGIGNLTVDAQSSKIIVSDIREVLEKVDALFEEISKMPLMIEIDAKVVKVTLDNDDGFGINWDVVNKGLSGSASVSVAPFSSFNGASTLGFTGSYTIGDTSFSSVIKAISQHYKTTLVSQPKILAVNREKAKIYVGEEVPYISAIMTNGNSEVSTLKVGISMTIEPQIAPQGEVRFSMEASFGSWVSYNVIGTQYAPKVNSTEISCVAMASNNQTVVIGGLISSSIAVTTNKIPLLGDIPLLGLLFSQIEYEVKREETLIFLTPHMVASGTSSLVSSTNYYMVMTNEGLTNLKNPLPANSRPEAEQPYENMRR